MLLRQKRYYGAENLNRLPDEKGAYLLVVHLHDAITLAPGRLSGKNLGAGWYVYAGSAYGPGGIRARVSRHFKTQKSLRWHVDYLTHGNNVYALALPKQRECDLVSWLLDTKLFATAIRNFGNSDCRTCESHLLMQIV